ncbi:hypothetical protein FACS1894166_05080 [Bacilli bacterium]|nr:hypothetical protein FACS1894166_05080 [Bacilli bacterium]
MKKNSCASRHNWFNWNLRGGIIATTSCAGTIKISMNKSKFMISDFIYSSTDDIYVAISSFTKE